MNIGCTHNTDEHLVCNKHCLQVLMKKQNRTEFLVVSGPLLKRTILFIKPKLFIPHPLF